MEPLWSPVVATGGNPRQMDSAQKPEKQAKTVAVACDQLPRGAHGKEGVGGSSPPESLKKSLNERFASCACCSGWRESRSARTPRLASLTPLLYVGRARGRHPFSTAPAGLLDVSDPPGDVRVDAPYYQRASPAAGTRIPLNSRSTSFVLIHASIFSRASL